MLLDWLRPPGPLDSDPEAYKDWLHLNLFHHASGTVGLVNVAVHGPVADPRSRVVGTALVDVPGAGWFGNQVVRGYGDTVIGPASVATDGVALAVSHAAGTVSASARLPVDGLDLRVRAVAPRAAPSVAIEERLPFGSGWISWYVAPRLAVTGTVAAGGTLLELAGASGYHDHNWGRWRWGDDVGWEWGTFVAPEPGPVVVLARTTDRGHRRVDPATVLASVGTARRVFRGATVRVATAGTLAAPPVRLPGALAALHQGRARPQLPDRVTVVADDGTDRVEVEFAARGAAQLVLAEPARRGYGFVHEVAGTVASAGRLGGQAFAAGGLGVFEHVD